MSLLEVIACTVLVGVMLIPLAGMMRASAHAWADAETTDVEVELRDAANYIRQTLADSAEILSVSASRVTFRRGAQVEWFEVRGGQLMRGGASGPMLVADRIESLRCIGSRRSMDARYYAIDFTLTSMQTQQGQRASIDAVAVLNHLRMP